jgi:hypothetical protein
MSRRRQELPDSLELLLDTICNTFGAVIFISMLLAVLAEGRSPNSSSDVSAVADRMLAEQERTNTSARAHLSQLRRLLDEQAELLHAFSDPDSQRLAAEIASAAEAQKTAIETRNEQLGLLAEQEAETAVKRHELAVAEQKRNEIRKQLKKVEDQLAAASKSASRTARTSRVRPAVGSGVSYMLHNGRLFRTARPDGDLDAADCELLQRGTVSVLKPRPAGGLPLPADSTAIRSRFSGFEPRQHYVRLFVSQNSFAEFLAVKDALVELQFEYEVILFEDQAAELFMTSKQINSFVQ